MTTADRVRRLWDDGEDCYAEIARRAKTSRQRVHQILGPRRFNPVAALAEAHRLLAEPIVAVIPGEAHRWPYCLACWRRMDGPGAEVARPGHKGRWKNAPVCRHCWVVSSYHRHRERRRDWARKYRRANRERLLKTEARYRARKAAGLVNPRPREAVERQVRAALALTGGGEGR